MVVAAVTLLVVVCAGPRGEPNRLVRVFVEGLLEKFWTRQAVMHPAGLPAAFGDGRDARVRLQVAGGLPAGAIGAEGGRQPRGADRARARVDPDFDPVQTDQRFVALLEGVP